MIFCQKHADFAVARFYLERLQIYFGRAVRYLACPNVETRVMPRALHVEPMEAALGERSKAMGAKFLKAVKLIINPDDCHYLLVNFNAQCFTIAQLFGVRNGNEGGLAITGRVSGRKMKRVLRSWRVTFVAPDRDSFVVNETATQITGHRQKANADDGEKERRQTNFWIAQCGRANPQINAVNCHNH